MATPCSKPELAKTAVVIREELERRAQRKRESMAAETARVHKHAPPKPTSYFEESNSETEGKVLLSSLIPSWNKGEFDLWVTVHDIKQYSDEQRAQIPKVDPMYLPNCKSAALLAYAIEYDDAPVFLHGAPSVGKTSLVNYICALLNRPFYKLNFFAHITPEHLVGCDKLRHESGATVSQWQDGVVPVAMRTPNAVMLLDEPTAGSAECQMVLQAALERGGRLFLADADGSIADRTVYAAPGMRWVMCDNTLGQGDPTGKFVGTSPQNSAWLDRVGTFVHVDWIDRTLEAQMLKKYAPDCTIDLCASIVSVASLLRDAYRKDELSTVCSMRVTQAWARHAARLRDPRFAFELAFVNRLDDPNEQSAVLETFRSVFK